MSEASEAVAACTWASAIALRVLWQIRRDPRTIAMLLVVPVVLLVLLKYVFYGQPQTFQSIGAPICATRDATETRERTKSHAPPYPAMRST